MLGNIFLVHFKKICSKTHLHFYSCPSGQAWEHWFSFSICWSWFFLTLGETLRTSDTRCLLRVSWVKEEIWLIFFLVLPPIGGILAPSSLLPRGLLNFIWNSLFMDPQLSVGLRYDFTKELAWEISPGIRVFVALRIWNSNSLLNAYVFLGGQTPLLEFFLRFLATISGNLKDSSLSDLPFEMSLE